MNCSVAKDMLGPFLDGELDANAEFQLRLHISECADCTATLTRLQTRLDMIRRGGLSYEAPSGLETRIRKSIRADQQTSTNWRLWGALAATLLIASTLSVRLIRQTTGTDAHLADQAVSSHVRAMMTGHTTDVTSTDGHTVKPWFNGRIDFSPPVTDLAQQGFPLVGGRVDYLGSRSVAALVYQRRKHIIDLFIWPAKKGDATEDDASNGYNILRWRNGGMSFVAVSDLNRSELEQFKNLLSKK